MKNSVLVCDSCTPIYSGLLCDSYNCTADAPEKQCNSLGTCVSGACECNDESILDDLGSCRILKCDAVNGECPGGIITCWPGWSDPLCTSYNCADDQQNPCGGLGSCTASGCVC